MNTSYTSLSTAGQLWLRNSQGILDTSNNVLSSVYNKYQQVNSSFFSDLTSNWITRFDVFYDTLFIETSTGSIFEKVYIDNGSIQPFNYRNNFTLTNGTPIDYWYNERDSKVYTSELLVPSTSGNYFETYLYLREYNCVEGFTHNNGIFDIKIAFDNPQHWTPGNYIIEAPKMTYNADNKKFNVSFIFKNNISQAALVTIIYKRTPEIELTEINSIIPFATFNAASSVATILDPASFIYDLFTISNYDVLVTGYGDVVVF